ncbi:type II secretion protein F, partial [Microbacterium maritypicum]
MSAISVLASAILIGGGFAAGVMSILSALPRWRAASLAVRIGPYVRDVVADDQLPSGVLPAAGALPASGRTL